MPDRTSVAAVATMQASSAAQTGTQINLEIVKQAELCEFVVLPPRWIVERTHRLAQPTPTTGKDWQCLNRRALAFLRWTSARRMLRKLCQESI